MPVLSLSEYDACYYEGKSQPYLHNAGYSEYPRMKNHCRKVADRIVAKTGKNGIFLELGCAYGFTIERLIELGVDATGIDSSHYAISQVAQPLKNKVKKTPALEYLKSLADQSVDWIYSIWFIECQSDLQLEELIPEMNRVSKQQIHITNPKSNPNFYNAKPITVLKKQGFKNTIIIQ